VQKRTLKISLIQSRIEKEYRENLARVRDIASTASAPDLMAIYENWLGRSPITYGEYLEASQELIDASRSRVLVSGSSYIKQEGVVTSKSLIIDRSGSISIGGKVFPSAATGERARISPGGPPAFMRTQHGFSVASVVCVDAAYPEIVRIAALMGADIIANPSIIPANRSYLWRSIGSSRAAENTVYFIHINPTGITYVDGREVLGGSFISDPQGRIVSEMGSEEGILEVVVELSEIDVIRNRWRYLEDVRGILEELYLGALERIKDRAEKRSSF